MSYAICFLFSFLVGSIPFGYLVPKLFARIDIRKEGSQNPGAANVYRVLGWKYGIVVLILDISKGASAVMLADTLFAGSNIILLFKSIAGLLSILGHSFTPFLNWRGGKGVATTLGVFVVLSPLTALGALVIFLVTYKIVKYVSVSSMVGSFSMPIFYYFLQYEHDIQKGGIFLFILLILNFFIIVANHRSNIQRLVSGQELRSR